MTLDGSTENNLVDHLVQKSPAPKSSDKRFFADGTLLQEGCETPISALIDTGASTTIFPKYFLEDPHRYNNGGPTNLTSAGGPVDAFSHMTFYSVICSGKTWWIASQVAFSPKVTYPILGVDFLATFNFNFSSTDKLSEFQIDLEINQHGRNQMGVRIFDSQDELLERWSDHFNNKHS